LGKAHTLARVELTAAIGITYGAFEYINYLGFWKGLGTSIVLVVFEYLAFMVAYPLWYRE